MSLDKNGQPIKYGPIKNEDSAPTVTMSMAASEFIPAGGAFTKADGTGRANIAAAGTTLLSGYIYPSEVGLDAGKTYQTGSATIGATFGPWHPISAMLGVIVRLPVISGTYVLAMRGQTCDLAVNGTTKAQGVALNLSSEDTVIIVEGDLVNNAWVDVVVNPAKITGLTGVV